MGRSSGANSVVNPISLLRKMFRKIVRLASSIRKSPPAVSSPLSTQKVDSDTVYESIVELLLCVQKNINVVVIGANDGVLNDPLFKVLRRYKGKISPVFIEPRQCIIPVLKDNYKDHPNAVFVNAAVGAAGKLKLFTIKHDQWCQYQPRYAQGWPAYRAPTGIASANYDHVLRHIHAYDRSLDAQQMIECIEVMSLNLSQLLRENCSVRQVDILQVDAEGNDDEVIYSSDLDKLKPLVVFYENSHLEASKNKKLERHLVSLGYQLLVFEANTVALMKGCFYNQLI